MQELVIHSKTKKIIFVFHGYGADKENLFPVAKAFAENIDEVEVHVPDGIERCPEGFGYQWFPLLGDDVLIWKDEYYKAESEIVSYVDKIVKEKGLTYKDVALTGFSQGGMIALMLGLKLGVKAIVSFSGLYLDPKMSVNQRHTKILLAHGKMDSVIPISEMYSAEEILKFNKMDVQTIVSEKSAHCIDDQLLQGAISFLKTQISLC
jgi:phospholipase/carboxylesterase